MPNANTVEDLLDFLAHASERGLMPAATSQALAVASRNVFSVLSEEERGNEPFSDLDGVIRRFNNKRARDFNPASLKEYGRRVHRAVDLYQQWLASPADFSVKTRASTGNKKKERSGRQESAPASRDNSEDYNGRSTSTNGYQTAFPVRPGHVVTIANIPYDLTPSEAERIAQFIRILAPAS
jgi:hypothetical protein